MPGYYGRAARGERLEASQCFQVAAACKALVF